MLPVSPRKVVSYCAHILTSHMLNKPRPESQQLYIRYERTITVYEQHAVYDLVLLNTPNFAGGNLDRSVPSISR